MAITPLTGFKAFRFDGEESTDYGVAILGEGVFNAPERDVEMITIPGRNGQFALDNGRFENIEVTYPANLIAGNTTDFATALSDFRNMLCSKKGYCRLEDDYHPDEYRMAVYKEGLEVDEKALRAGEFDITFDCKPQRYLTSGETKQTIASSGDTITNPTLFESSPLLEVEGYGDLTANGQTITLNNETLGEIVVTEPKGGYLYDEGSASVVATFDENLLNPGDSIIFNGQPVSDSGQTYYGSVRYGFKIYFTGSYAPDYATKSATNLAYSSIARAAYDNSTSGSAYLNTVTFVAGTASTYSGSLIVSQPVLSGSTVVETATISITMSLAYDGNNTITATVSWSVSNDSLGAITLYREEGNGVSLGRSRANSSVSILGNPTYIDCDLGEAYMIESGSVISLNQYIDLGSQLPTLAPGANEFTFDNTITDLKVIPRWWKI